MEHTDDPIVAEQWRAEHHPYALLPEDWIRHRGRIDPLQEYCFLAGRDSTREPHSDRYLDALPHFLFEPSSGARDEEARAVLDEQNRSRVRVENHLHALEQLVEKFVNAEPGQAASVSAVNASRRSAASRSNTP